MVKCGAFQVRHDGSDLSCILPNTSPLSLGRNVIYAVLESLSKDVLRDARQPEVSLSPFIYALTLTNLYC